MSDRLGSPRHLVAHPIARIVRIVRIGARLVLAETLIPVGVAAAAGLAAAAIVPPHWRAAGLPYLVGYGKNVEAAAIAAALGAGAATQLLARSRRGLAACAALAALGFALVAARCPLGPLLAGWPQLAAIAALAAAIGANAHGTRNGSLPARPPAPLGTPSHCTPPAPSTTPAPSAPSAVSLALAPPSASAPPAPSAPPHPLAPLTPLLDAALVTAMAGAVFAVTVGPRLLQVDVFHHGEVLATAVDLLRGGRPFETLIWPHGLHDTGLAALWMRATGKVGTSPVALAAATCAALGIVAVYFLVRRLLDSRPAALAAGLAAALAPLVLAGDPALATAGALGQLGVLIFTVLAFAAVTAPRPRPFAAGVCSALAHLFRIEIGVYTALAALAVLAYVTLTDRVRARGSNGAWSGAEAASPQEAVASAQEAATPRPRGGAERTRAARAAAPAAALLRFLAGCALVLAGARLLFGWPGGAWFAYTLLDLPRYHRDAVGLPFAWPVRGAVLSPVESIALSIALSRLLLTLLLLVQAARALLARRERSPLASPFAPPFEDGGVQAARALLDGRERTAAAPPGRPEGRLLFVALFAALSAKSALDRSDLSHLLAWSALPLLAAACLALAAWARRRSWGPLRTAAAAFVLLFTVDFGWLGLHLPAPRGPADLVAVARGRWHALGEHLRPNPPAGACGDRMLTPEESRLGTNPRLVADECAVEGLLRSHGVVRMAIVESAAWYDVRFGSGPATRYIALARAYTPPRQLDYIAALRARPVQALLRPRGYGAVRVFDVPDAVRVPVADAYLKARRDGVAATPTPLGDLFFWDEPAPGAPPVRSGSDRAPAATPARPLTGPEWAGLAAAIERAQARGRADRAAAAVPPARAYARRSAAGSSGSSTRKYWRSKAASWLSSSEYGPGSHARDTTPLKALAHSSQSWRLVRSQNSIAGRGSKPGAAIASGWNSQSHTMRVRSIPSTCTRCTST